jgi:hypothetical protein
VCEEGSENVRALFSIRRYIHHTGSGERTTRPVLPARTAVLIAQEFF